MASAGIERDIIMVRFEEFSAVEVREVDSAEAAQADFALVATLATWRVMIDSIAASGGRPTAAQSDLEPSQSHGHVRDAQGRRSPESRSLLSLQPVAAGIRERFLRTGYRLPARLVGEHSQGDKGYFYIDRTCIGCGACEHACPGKIDAIARAEVDFLGRFVIDEATCINCGVCIPLCPVLCIHDACAEARRGQRRLAGHCGFTGLGGRVRMSAQSCRSFCTG